MFDLRDIFQEHNPGIKRDLPLMTNALALEFNAVSVLQKLEFEWGLHKSRYMMFSILSITLHVLHSRMHTHTHTHTAFVSKRLSEGG